MKYLFSKGYVGDSFDWLELDFSERYEVTKFVANHLDELKTFAVCESGNIYGYSVEMSEDSKPKAILYPHKIAQLIWIDMT